MGPLRNLPAVQSARKAGGVMIKSAQERESAYMAEIDRLEGERDTLKRKNRSLQAIIDTHPKTADGVPLVPGMVVWHAYWAGPQREVFESFSVYVEEPNIWMSNEAGEGALYSTREAAGEAIDAKKKLSEAT